MKQARICITNLGQYNEGQLLEEWVNLPVTDEELNNVYERIGLGYYDQNNDYHHGLEVGGISYEEMAIHDYEAPFKIDEYDDINKLNELAGLMDGMEDDEIDIASALLDNGIHPDFEVCIEMVKNQDGIHIYCQNNMADIAEEFYEENGSIDRDNPLSKYIDWEAVGRDMEINGMFIQVNNNLWVEVFN